MDTSTKPYHAYSGEGGPLPNNVAIIPGWFAVGRRSNGTRLYAQSQCFVPYDGRYVWSQDWFEVLHGSNIEWKLVDGQPGGVVDGYEHDGAQIDGICRVPMRYNFGNPEGMTGEIVQGKFDIGKDYGGRCFYNSRLSGRNETSVDMNSYYETSKYKK